jgi:signal transduction histidine kinase
MTLIADEHTVFTSSSGGDRAHPALGFIHKILQSPNGLAFPTLLGELAAVFGASGAGFAFPSLGSPIVQHHIGLNGRALPWDNDPTLLDKARNSPSPVALEANGSWLITSVWVPQFDPGLLWLEAGPRRPWTAGDQAAFCLAGEALGRCATARLDTNDRRRSAERDCLQRRMENTAQVTGRLAHDFGNILTGILGFAELSLSLAPADSPQRKYLSEVVQSAQHGANWVRKLQVFSRRSRPKGACRLPVLIGEEADCWRLTWGNNIALLVAPVDTLPPVAVDAAAVRDMLRQLLANAGEAITGRGVVALSARTTELSEHDCLDLVGNARPGPHVEITIADTGSGISTDTRRRLFAEAFFSTRNRQRGLGLAMVYAHLSAYQGGLQFGPPHSYPSPPLGDANEHVDTSVTGERGKGEGQGTAVRLYLPVASSLIATPLPRDTGEGALRPTNFASSEASSETTIPR